MNRELIMSVVADKLDAAQALGMEMAAPIIDKEVDLMTAMLAAISVAMTVASKMTGDNDRATAALVHDVAAFMGEALVGGGEAMKYGAQKNKKGTN